MRLEPEVASALESVSFELLTAVPELRAILDEARESGRPEAEVMIEVLTLLVNRPDLAAKVEAVAQVANLPALPENTPDAELLMVPARGLPRLNPAYEASIMERLQFDGDVPELRTGPMSPGASPAVPVSTDSCDPVSIGWMLEDAAEQVASEIRSIEKRREDEVAAILGEEAAEAATTGALQVTEPGVLALLDRTTMPDPEGYVRGQVPATREVEKPEGWALASLTDEQRGQLAWRFISTTQGRRTATEIIRNIVADGLRQGGFTVDVAQGEPSRVEADAILAHAEWTVAMSGPNSVQPGFAFVDIASAVLLKRLGQIPPSRARLEVVPVNTVDVRQVGWAARLIRVEG